MAHSRKTINTLLLIALALLSTNPAASGNYRSMTPIKATINSVPWDPTMLTGQIALFIADAANVTLSGSDVTTWSDLSPNGYHATGGGVSLPTFNASCVNAQGCITFANTGNQSLSFSNTADIWNGGGSTGTSIYTVMQFSDTGGERIYFSGHEPSGSFGYPILEFNNNVAGDAGFLFSYNNNTVNPGMYAFWLFSPGTVAWHIVDYTYNGSGLGPGTSGNNQMYVDRSLISIDTSKVYTDYGSGNTIGNYVSGGGSGFTFHGNISAVIILDHPLTGTERTNIDTWVSTKYGI